MVGLNFIILVFIISIILLTIVIEKLINKIPQSIIDNKIYKIFKNILCIILIVTGSFNIYNRHYKKIDFDKNEARVILENTYKPVKLFREDIISDKTGKIILPPKYIGNESDFLNFFDDTFPEYNVKELYDHIIVERDDNSLEIDKSVHFYCIYDEGSDILKAYIKKRKDSEELIIEEVGNPTDGGFPYTRKHTFKKDENDKWICKSISGGVVQKFD
ncbi:hypothetical protein [Clostridium ganghwense]|uniref:Tim44-like domain-containing protein n=1 Tax=Clostridium ganghwense TaxID=312089 RepID=A0ABT4CNM8_9CLOT|nr:hypothetical protein [Clostridium ganghwense]MCY6370652.1 hypothetical protein [Clostridium ganghwense]